MAIKLNIGSLKEGSQKLELTSDAKELGLDESLIDDKVTIALDLHKTVHQLDIRADIGGVFKMECDRCLEGFQKQFNAKFELVYVQKTAREEVIDDDYIRTYNPFMKQVDITGDIKEVIILSVPMKHLPAEKQDGSCSWCGRKKDFWNNIIIDEEELNQQE